MRKSSAPSSSALQQALGIAWTSSPAVRVPNQNNILGEQARIDASQQGPGNANGRLCNAVEITQI
jgi:hypothetical protein